jgi:hypothetical protein
MVVNGEGEMLLAALVARLMRFAPIRSDPGLVERSPRVGGEEGRIQITSWMLC